MDITGLRKDYQNLPLRKDMLAPNPLHQFEQWFVDASQSGQTEPNAMTLATAGMDGMVSQRTVLLKFFDERGFVFFTNYGSRKARQIAENPRVSLLFAWIGLARQVAICGTAEKISAMESARYFSSRPHDSQLGAWISRQSSIISSRQLLLNELNKIKNKFRQGDVPLPDFWGGYRVRPASMEFWQGQTSRLHDRFLYTREDDNHWRIERLAP